MISFPDNYLFCLFAMYTFMLDRTCLNSSNGNRFLACYVEDSATGRVLAEMGLILSNLLTIIWVLWMICSRALWAKMSTVIRARIW